MTDIVILCAGRGGRMGSCTSNMPKSMVRIMDKPIIHWIYDAISELDDIGYINIISGYRYNVIEPYVKVHLDSDVRFTRQNRRTGTADAIGLLKHMISDDFIVLAGDSIYDSADLRKLADWQNCLLYTELDRVGNLYEYGTLNMTDSYIDHINEKSSNPTSNLINCSAYHFTKDVFDYIPNTPIDKRFNERIIADTINLMIDDGYKFGGIKINDYYTVSYPEDIGAVEGRMKKHGKEDD